MGYRVKKLEVNVYDLSAVHITTLYTDVMRMSHICTWLYMFCALHFTRSRVYYEA
jgi:hypothetical protein